MSIKIELTAAEARLAMNALAGAGSIADMDLAQRIHEALASFAPKMRVRYIPGHAHGDRDHKDCEDGTVSSTNERFVFVKFDKQLARFGWDGTTSQSCRPDDLVRL